ncbi:unnamed protein product [Adineta ricciae]|uniref:Uncharacterized protein n=1 Tax=Adineta ricciae TaxID=249248 RepID=A0A814CPY7_ADIRI|nr:unnamed protein product [Adineta ricciae]CAF1014201.1 unnamed protein product [Adineta ricciae]
MNTLISVWRRVTYFLFICLLVIILVFVLDFELNDKIQRNAFYKTLSKKTRNLGIIIVLDKTTQNKYKQHSENMKCYAKQHEYTFIILNPESYSNCSLIKNFFFQKHCAVLNYMKSMINIQWFAVLDGDIFAFNNSKLIEDFIPNNTNIHLIYYERFYTGEIMAGAYLIENHPWSHRLLYKWSQFYFQLPRIGYHNHDNGALHMIFLEMIEKPDEILKKCHLIYLRSSNEQNYYRYLRCFRCAIGGQRLFQHIQVLRRGHGFARDFHIPFINDFLLHGHKDELNQYFHNPTKCTTNWLTNIKENSLISNLEIAKNMTKAKDEYAMRKYSISLGIPDITDCWPNCEQNITGNKLVKYLAALCD